MKACKGAEYNSTVLDLGNRYGAWQGSGPGNFAPRETALGTFGIGSLVRLKAGVDAG
jgi:hypothetical protein